MDGQNTTGMKYANRASSTVSSTPLTYCPRATQLLPHKSADSLTHRSPCMKSLQTPAMY